MHAKYLLSGHFGRFTFTEDHLLNCFSSQTTEFTCVSSEFCFFKKQKKKNTSTQLTPNRSPTIAFFLKGYENSL